MPNKASQENKLNPARQNEFIQQSIADSLKAQFPIVGTKHTLELVGQPKIKDDVDDYDFPAQKEIKLNGKTWQVPIYGTFRLRDNKTGMVMDEAKDIKIANVPKLTDRFSMIINGNEYTTINQFRLKPGVYTRRKDNGEMESLFNLAVGYNFKMELDPAAGIFYIYVAKQRFHLYTLLHALGVSDSEMQKAWGNELFQKNQAAGINLGDKEIPLLWEKLRRQKLSYAEALSNIQTYFANTKMDPNVNEITLGGAYDSANAPALLATSVKLLKVMRGDEPEDERDSLLFKQLYTVDDQVKEYLKKTSTTLEKNLKYRTDNKDKIREIISPQTYTEPIKKFFTVGDLSTTSPQTNPVEMASEWRKTTVTGTGGIKSEHAITFKTRDVHPSHFGFLDPLHTPEGHKVGVTLSLGLGVRKRGDDLTTTIIAPDGTEKEITPKEFYDMKIGFPDQHEKGNPVDKKIRIMYHGKVDEVPAKEVQGYLYDPVSMFGWTTNMVPFLGHNSGNRAAVASKMASQAVPLKNPESALVKVEMPSGTPIDKILGRIVTTLVPADLKKAKVTNIDADYITLQSPEGTKRKVGLYNYFPLNQESFLQSTPIVKVGDEVKAGQLLARNNYTDTNNDYAYGINANVAYMPWYGYNFEDGIVVTDSLAKKLTSTVMLKESLQTSADGILNKKKFLVFYPTLLTPANLDKLDDEGVIKLGSVVQPGETLIAYLQKIELNDTEKILRQMNKVISNPYRNRSLVWAGEHDALVKDIRRIGNTINVWLYEEQPLVVGDKLAGRYGDKGIVTKIIPDNEAPRTKDGKVIELMFNPHGVVGRMNLGQMLEMGATKIADKTGKPYVVRNFSKTNHLKEITKKMKELKIPADEILYDINGKPITQAPVFTGKKYYLKLMHVVEHKYKARDIPGTYDANEQPARGDEGGQSLDPLQMYSLLAHGARKNLYEMAAIKSQRNDEYWRNLQLGFTPPPPKKNFVFDKMLTYMEGAGININKKGDNLILSPTTDKQTLAKSSGEIPDAAKMLRGKDLVALEGGLFDPKLTGGPRGTNWNHITLAESMPNPLYESAIQNLTGLNGREYAQVMDETLAKDDLTGAALIRKRLAQLDVDKELKAAEAELKTAPPTKVNFLHNRIKYLQTLNENHLKPVDAYMMSVVPVIPSVFRPIYPLPSGDLQVSPINKHYRDVALINNQIKAVKQSGLGENFNKNNRASLYKALQAMTGLIDPITYSKEKYEGLLQTLAGGAPKAGFVQNKVWGRRQDLSGRSTVTVDPSLGIDELGMPEPMLKTVLKPFIIKEMVKRGYKPVTAIQQYKDWSPAASQALNVVIKERPVLMNRAPSLHKHNVQAFYPVRREGMSIGVSPLVVKGFNMDFDGDQQIGIVLIAIKTQKNRKIKNLDFTIDSNPFYWYNNASNYHLTKKWIKKLATYFNTKLPIKNTEYYICNLEDFPHLDTLIGEKDGRKFYDVENIQVIALDENTNKLQLVPVAAWSIHPDREVWTVELLNGKQIISDDDPRAVYGIKAGTLDFIRNRPKDSVGMLVPIAKSLVDLQNIGHSLTEIKGQPNSKIKDHIKLNGQVGYILGALIGDGWVDIVNNTPRATNLAGIELSVVGQYQDFLLQIFKERPHIGHSVSTKSLGQSEKWIVSSVDYATWVYPLIGKGALNKHLPPFWFNTTREFKLGLLSGLLDTDGSISVSHGKNKPQLMANISSTSIRLIQECQQLLLTLGVRSKISFSKKTQAGNDFWILTISAVDLYKIKDDLLIAHENNKAAFSEAVPSDESANTTKFDVVPITPEIVSTFTKLIGAKRDSSKSDKTLYQQLHKAKSENRIARAVALELLSRFPSAEVPAKWVKIVKAASITWEPVISFENTGKIETGYDLSVPGYETFMSIDGIILSNTASIHVPVGDAAVEEAKRMLPSKNLHKAGDKEQLMVLSQDYQLGLYFLTVPGKNTGRKFSTIQQAMKAGLGMQDQFTLNGKKMTLGKALVNSVLPKNLQDYDTEFNGKYVRSLLEKVYKEHPQDFGKVIDHFKDIGRQYAVERGSTLSISDIDVDRTYRDKILKKYEDQMTPKMPEADRLKLYMDAKNEIVKKQDEELGKTNRFYDLLRSGSSSKGGQVAQILSMPGLVEDLHGKPIPFPIKKSWAEGVDTSDYWNQSYGARKGVVDKSINTQESGGLNKELLSVTKDLLVVEEDCNTPYFIEVDLRSKEVMDRFLGEDVRGVGKRNDLVDTELVTKARSKNLTTLPVRSPLTCEADGGVCVKCYGLMADGQLPRLGENVGVLDSQAVTERSTQLTLQTFHTGGVAGTKSGILAGFPRLKELLYVPDTIVDKAVLAENDGTVNSIIPNPAGGFDLKIGTDNYYIPRERRIIVNVGQVVKRGDLLTDGNIKPQELSNLRNHLEAQLYSAKEINKIYGNSFAQKSLETVLRSTSNLTDIDHIPEGTDVTWMRGDTVPLSAVNKMNRELKAAGKELIKHTPFFKSIDVLPMENEDWLARLTTNRLKQTIQDSAAMGAQTNIHGHDPMPGYLYGTEFGQLNPKEKKYY